MFLKRICLSACVSVFFLSPVLAEESPAFNLGEIIVSPDDKNGGTISSAIEITSRDIKMKNAGTVAEALDGIPGVFMSTGAKNEADIKLRGIAQDKTLVLVDGFPVTGPYYGYIDLNQIPVENVVKIKVIKGPASTLYGGNFLGGVINIITKEPVGKPLTTASLNIARYDSLHSEFTHGQRRDKLSLFVSGSFRKSGGFALSDSFTEKVNEDGGKRDNSDYEREAFSLKAGFEPADDRSFAVSFNYIDNEEGIPYHTTSSNPRYWRFPKWEKWNIAFMQDVKFSTGVSVKGRVFYDKHDNILKSYDDASLTTQAKRYAFTSTYDDYGTGGSIHPAFELGENHLLKGALHLKADIHREQSDVDEAWEKYRARTYSVALEDKISLRDNLSLTVGGSFDGFHVEERDMKNPGFYLGTQFDTENGSEYWIALSRKSRFPALHQFYSSYSGNLDLKEEKGFNSELGMRCFRKNNVSAKVVLFANRVDDLIEREGKREPYLNIAQATFEGIETELEATLNEYNRVVLGYSYLSAREKISSGKRRLRYTPEHEAYFKLNGSKGDHLSYYLGLFYVGKRCWYDDDVQQELSDYCLLNAKITQEVGMQSEVFISVENLLDEDYEEEDGFPQQGRTVWVGLKSEF